MPQEVGVEQEMILFVMLEICWCCQLHLLFRTYLCGEERIEASCWLRIKCSISGMFPLLIFLIHFLLQYDVFVPASFIISLNMLNNGYNFIHRNTTRDSHSCTIADSIKVSNVVDEVLTTVDRTSLDSHAY